MEYEYMYLFYFEIQMEICYKQWTSIGDILPGYRSRAFPYSNFNHQQYVQYNLLGEPNIIHHAAWFVRKQYQTVLSLNTELKKECQFIRDFIQTKTKLGNSLQVAWMLGMMREGV